MRSFKSCLKLLIILVIVIKPVQLISQNLPDSLSTAATLSDTSGQLSNDAQTQTDIPQDQEKRLGFNTQTLLDLFDTAKEFGSLLMIVFLLGMLFIFQQWFVLNREKKDAQKIPIEKLKSASLDDINSMFTKIEDINTISEDDDENEKVPLLKRIFRRKKASAFELLYRLYKIYETQHTTTDFNEEITKFVQYFKDMFNPFLTRLAFFSDTAGGLGLLGTVWGMFLVFYKGSPDQTEVLSGMGIALSTTIIGLVISIILNSFTTVICNLFDKHLDRINKMANIFQERLMKEEVRHPKPLIISQAVQSSVEPQEVVTPPENNVQAPEPEKVAPVESQKPTVMYGTPSEIKIISGDNQTGEVNSLLPKPLIVEVRDKQGNLLESETVVFTAENGAGTFPNSSRVQKLLTDEDGRVQTQLLLGKRTGEKIVRIMVEGSDSRGVTSIIKARPTPPEKFIELKGNYQTGELDKRLEEPFIVAIKDRYDNPIPRHEVNFQLKKGSGRFQDSQNSQFITTTNEDGLAEVYFIMGNNRGAREIEVEAKKVEPSKIKFEIFAI